MTKKDYIKFADMIAKVKVTAEHPEQDDILNEVQYSMTNIFKKDNPNFDENKFNKYIEQKVAQLSR